MGTGIFKTLCTRGNSNIISRPRAYALSTWIACERYSPSLRTRLYSRVANEMSITTQENHDAHTNTSSIDAVCDVLNVTSDYLLESAYGSAYLTVSANQMELARRLALAVLASYVQHTHVSFTIDREDLPSVAMTYTAFLLSKAWTLSAGECSPSNSLNLQANEADVNTSRRVAFSPYPSRDLSDCGYMRGRIARVAALVTPYASGMALYRALGSMAGADFAYSAEHLAVGGTR